jgi:glycosyl transferase family 2
MIMLNEHVRGVLSHLRELPTVRAFRNLLRQLCGSSCQERRISELARNVRRVRAQVERIDLRVARQLQELDSSINEIVGRLDWALARAEGMIEEIEAFEAARETVAYREPFEKQNPLVSVVIATMNRAELLMGRTLPSVLHQSFENLQIVIVGDHCLDDTDKRLSSLRDHRITFKNLSERGPYPSPGPDRWRVAGTNAMNYGLSLCEGDFVTHIDDDDRMAHDRIESMIIAAQQERAEFLWHPFWMEDSEGDWTIVGNGELQYSQVTTGSIFYHRYFARVPWDVRAYRAIEPGDWNRIRRIKALRPHLHFVPKLLMYHHAEQMQGEFVRQPGERFLT